MRIGKFTRRALLQGSIPQGEKKTNPKLRKRLQSRCGKLGRGREQQPQRGTCGEREEPG